jgi:hypothetical protein
MSATGGRAARNPAGQPARGAARALGLPQPVRVRAGAGGAPREVDGRRIEALRESWLVEDRWWAQRPLRRRYWEVLDARGENLVVFHDLQSGGWFKQSA